MASGFKAKHEVSAIDIITVIEKENSPQLRTAGPSFSLLIQQSWRPRAAHSSKTTIFRLTSARWPSHNEYASLRALSLTAHAVWMCDWDLKPRRRFSIPNTCSCTCVNTQKVFVTRPKLRCTYMASDSELHTATAGVHWANIRPKSTALHTVLGVHSHPSLQPISCFMFWYYWAFWGYFVYDSELQHQRTQKV